MRKGRAASEMNPMHKVSRNMARKRSSATFTSAFQPACMAAAAMTEKKTSEVKFGP